MTTARDLQTGPIADRFDHLFAVIGSQKFLRMEGLGKEVPFFVIPYNPAETIEMERLKGQLANKLMHKGIRVLEVNLYDLTKELMEKVAMDGRTDWDFWIDEETKHDKGDLLEAIQSLVDSESKIAPAFAEKIEATEFEVMFISGVGEVFPFTTIKSTKQVILATPKGKCLKLPRARWTSWFKSFVS